MSQDNPRIAVLGFAIECNRFSPVTTAEDFEHDVDIRGNRIVSEARSGKSITMPDLPGFFDEMDRTGPWTPVPLARVAGAARRPGRGAVLQGLSRRDRVWPEIGAAGRRDLRLLPRRGAGAGYRRSRRRPVRNPAPRRRPRRAHRLGVRPACQRLPPHDRQSQRLRRLPREPAHRHLRARRRVRKTHARAAGGREDGDRDGEDPAGAAADRAADREGPLCRPDQLRPVEGRRRHPERLGDGGLRLQRQSQERPHRRRHGAQRQPQGRRATWRSTSPSAPGA